MTVRSSDPDTAPHDQLHPVLVADLEHEEDRAVLDAAACTGARVWVPLDAAPATASAHVLEVYIRAEEACLYMCAPLGPPTSAGFPLRLWPMPNVQIQPPPKAPDRFVVRGRHSHAAVALSKSHARALAYAGPLPIDAAQDRRIGRTLARGKLVIEQLLGRGGVGAVYKARHRELQKAVAVKVLHEFFQHDIDFSRRFYAEALGASRLDHPNITHVIDFGQEPDGELYFAMEFLDGVELRAVLGSERKLAAGRIASLMMQVCAGLAHAHARGLVHRDIKPENLMLMAGTDDDGRPTEIVKICDFGIAVHGASAAQAEGSIAGTPEYMSPEQCRAEQLDARSDVYSCGVVLYELATGKLPFIADAAPQLFHDHQFTEPVPPSKIEPSVAPGLEAIIMRALAKDANGRYASMRDLRADLRALLASSLDGSRSAVSVPDGNASGNVVTTAGKVERAIADRSPSFHGVTDADVVPASGLNTSAGSRDGDLLAASASAFLERLARTFEPTMFAAAAQQLEREIGALAQRGEVDALCRISNAMQSIATEGQAAVGSRAWSAAKLLRVFEDPTILTHIAAHALDGPAATRDKARGLLVRAGVAGAYGLYGARVKLNHRARLSITRAS